MEKVAFFLLDKVFIYGGWLLEMVEIGVLERDNTEHAFLLLS